MRAFPLYCRRPALRTVVRAFAVSVFTFVALVVALPPGPTQATDNQSAVDASLAWLISHQKADGSFPGFSEVGGTADGIYALAAGGQDPRGVFKPGGHSPLEFLETKVDSFDCNAADHSDCSARSAGQVATAAEASSANPKRFAGSDLIAAIKATFDEDSGAYRETKVDPATGKYFFLTNTFDQAFAILGLAGSRVHIPGPAISNLLSSQQQDGGWEFSPGFGTDTNSTALALQALIAARRADPRIDGVDAAKRKTLEFFRAEQNTDGGFAYQKAYAFNFCGGQKVSDSNSTAYSTQAILSAGEDPAAAGWIGQGGGPVDFLLSMQNTDGSLNYQQGADCSGDPGATSQAIPALAGQSFVCLVRLGTCQVASSADSAGPAQAEGRAVALPASVPTPSPTPARRTETDSARAPAMPSEISKSPSAPASRSRSAPGLQAGSSPSPSTVPVVGSVASADSLPAPQPVSRPDSKSQLGAKAIEAVGGSSRGGWTPLNWVGLTAALAGGALLVAAVVNYFRKRRNPAIP